MRLSTSAKMISSSSLAGFAPGGSALRRRRRRRVLVGTPFQVEAERVLEHLFVAVGRHVPDDTLSPACRSPGRGSRCRPAAVRRSAAPVYSTAAPRRSAATVDRRRGARGHHLVGIGQQTCIPAEVALRVVSLPATVSRNMNMSNSSSLGFSPSISALMRVVTMSSRGRRAAGWPGRWRRRRSPRGLQGAVGLSRVPGTRGPGRRSWRWTSRRAGGGPPGDTHDLGDGLRRELGGRSETQASQLPCSMTESTISSAQ